jgi:hypothetical protein
MNRFEFDIGDWLFTIDFHALGQFIKENGLWGQIDGPVVDVWWFGPVSVERWK